MDALTSLMRTMRLNAQVFHNAQYCGRFAVDTSGSGFATFHYVVKGHCRLDIPGKQPIWEPLSAGDFVVFPSDAPHYICTSAEPERDANQQASQPMTVSDEQDAVGLVCGYLQFDHVNSDAFLQALPRHILLRTKEEPHAGNLAPLLKSLDYESRHPGLGSELVLDRYADILFMYVMRDVLLNNKAELPLLAGLSDKQIGAALGLVHAEPERAWTVDSLASEVGMSRTAFSQRFKQLSGLTPMAYCTQWRMMLAYRWLRDDGITVLDAALRCGYETEAAFSKAFKREMGVSPGALRKNAGASGEASS